MKPEPSSLPASLREPHTDLVAAWDWEFDAEFLDAGFHTRADEGGEFMLELVERRVRVKLGIAGRKLRQ